MNILFILLNNKKSINKNNYDPRFIVFEKIIYYLKNNTKHSIIISEPTPQKNFPEYIKKDFKFIEHKDRSKFKNFFFDLCISFNWVGDATKKKIKYKNKKCKSIFFENGHLKDSIIIDPKGLIEKSKYIESLDKICKINYKDPKEYINDILINNYSKRPQNNDLSDIPINIYGNFIFIPTQYHKDKSFHKKKIGMIEGIKETVLLCKKYELPLVIKIHPNLDNKHLEYQKTEIENLRNTIYNKIYLSKMSINKLIQNSYFTVLMNGASIMDNFINHSLVISILPTMYSYTDAVIYKEDLEESFNIILNKNYNLENIIRKQDQIISWYLQNNLFLNKTVEDNIKALEYHCKLKII